MNHYRLYIDESGDDTFNKLNRAGQTNDSLDSLNKRYLCLLGVVIEDEKLRKIRHSLNNLKRNHFPQQGNNPVILHYYDIKEGIKYGKGFFGKLSDVNVRNRFFEQLSQFLSEQDYFIIAVTIDKLAQSERPNPVVPQLYHKCLSVLLSCYCGFLNFNNAFGDVIVERRGKKEDQYLNEAYKYILSNGTEIIQAENIARALTDGDVEIVPKKDNIAGIQVADILAYPVRQEILIENGRTKEPNNELDKVIRNAIASKYNRKVKHERFYCYGRFFIA